MSALISLEKISLSFGAGQLLDDVNFQINAGERVCLIGRNGAGKSSFLKVIEGHMLPDLGKIHRNSHLKIARLEQELPNAQDKTVYEVVLNGQEPDWQLDLLLEKTFTRLQLNPEDKVSELSGGWQRRVALAKALAQSPDLLLLDEPTNHLDIEAIAWLEEELLAFRGGMLFITHDRALLKRLATRIIELDRGQLTSWPGDYDNFLRRKDEMLAAEATANREFDKKLAEEEKWIRQGIKARRTRNEGRVRALEQLRRERGERRDVQGVANITLNQMNTSGELIINAEDITYGYDDTVIIRDFSTRIMRGDRIGLVGPNGVGKTTLMNLLLGKLKPQEGHVQLGTKLEIAYFDQLRSSLDDKKNIIDNVAGGRTSIHFNGRDKHIVGYLNDFLFSPDRLHTPVGALSGGECNRILLAKLFSLPFNFLIMDEPTNDLDIETLELLEELLSEFKGTLLLVSHDRAFLENIVTSTFVFEGDGKVTEHIGGYQPWMVKSSKPEKKEKKAAKSEPIKVANVISGKEHKEYSALPNKIAQSEKKQAEYFAIMAEPNFYSKPSKDQESITEKLKQVEADIAALYARWEELEAKINS